MDGWRVDGYKSKVEARVERSDPIGRFVRWEVIDKDGVL